MLFAAGRPVRSLGDYIDENDPCTLNPNDPICQAVGPQIDPCKVNPNQAFCQDGVVRQTITQPDPGSNDSQWSQYVSPSQSQPSWVDKLIASFQSFAPGLKPTSPGVATTASAGVSKFSWGLLGLLVVAGGVFGYQSWRKRNP